MNELHSRLRKALAEFHQREMAELDARFGEHGTTDDVLPPSLKTASPVTRRRRGPSKRKRRSYGPKGVVIPAVEKALEHISSSFTTSELLKYFHTADRSMFMRLRATGSLSPTLGGFVKRGMLIKHDAADGTRTWEKVKAAS